jgi:ACT domain-containing protein
MGYLVVEESGLVRLTVLARDQPGELIRILQPLSEHNANIQGVFHDHSRDGDKTMASGSVPVEITFTFDPLMSEEDKKQRIDKIKQDLSNSKIQILNMSIELFETTKTQHVILIGPIFETDIHDSIVQITSTGARIADMQAAIASADTPQSTVMFKIEYEKDDIQAALMRKLSELSSKKKLKYITS